MTLISAAWSCQKCGDTFISEPPEHLLCEQCLAELTALACTAFPGTATCPSCRGPVCPDCAQAMTIVLTVTVPAPGPDDGQASLLITAYSTHLREVSGHDA